MGWPRYTHKMPLRVPGDQGIRAEPTGSKIHVPLVAFLRSGNIIGGGFMLTTRGRVPVVVRDYANHALAAGGAGSAAAAAAVERAAVASQ